MFRFDDFDHGVVITANLKLPPFLLFGLASLLGINDQNTADVTILCYHIGQLSRAGHVSRC